MKNRLEKGAGLLEVMLVLVIAVIIILMSTRYYQTYKKTREIGLFQTTVSELMNALNNYYFANCWQKSFDVTAVNRQKLIAWQIANKLNLIGNIDYSLADFEVYIIDPNANTQNAGTFYLLKVTTAFNNNNIQLANYIRGALNGDAADVGTNKVTWTRLPLYSKDELSSHQWIMNQRIGQEFMPGRFTTAVNTGGSKFWVLNSGLQSFTKANIDANNSKLDYKVCPN